ncbi:dephospho-CoA kinase [Streptococcus parasuis]|uniref:dephospho-CoA kinase n=1 Tax=Streptococcus parasuis TaxID=1501662 RepID=UPI002378EAA9|nr:dephospho-CoA kinase [Streptococcus parasuis]WDN58029.1 dephospho-CoA kinase [Streptococcus parasuis]WDN59846.1 dephospho-CoA kinase [Streptococcus parasuis]
MTKVIGLTGGIASGKSTITDFLRRQGYPVIDADQVVHELQAKDGKLYQVLVAEFGNSILTAEGDLDRKKLGQAVFENAGLRAHSSLLQDKIIREELLARRDALKQTEDVIFMDIPLLYEADYSGEVDEVWLVYVDKAQQLERLMKRNGFSVQDAENRLKAQLSLEEKRSKAQVLIDNSGVVEETLSRVALLLEDLQDGRQ